MGCFWVFELKLRCVLLAVSLWCPRPAPAESSGCIYSLHVFANRLPSRAAVWRWRPHVCRRPLPALLIVVRRLWWWWWWWVDGLVYGMPSTIMCAYQSHHDSGRSDWSCFVSWNKFWMITFLLCVSVGLSLLPWATSPQICWERLFHTFTPQDGGHSHFQVIIRFTFLIICNLRFNILKINPSKWKLCRHCRVFTMRKRKP